MSKINVAITQREVIINDEIYEALAASWNKIANNCNFNIINLSSYDDKLLEKISYFECKAVILTGGGDLVENTINASSSTLHLPQRQVKEIEVIQFCLKNQIAMIGICRGMQALNLFFGGSLIDIQNHIRAEVKIRNTDLKYLSLTCEKVLCHHKKGISHESLAKNFKIIAESGLSIETILDQERRILGFMWHPERNLNRLHEDFYLQFKGFIHA